MSEVKYGRNAVGTEVGMIKPKQLPKDYVEEAEQVMNKLGRPDERNPGKLIFKLTTSKIRNILSMISEVYNVESRNTSDRLEDESIDKLNMIRVRVLYESGRDMKNDYDVERFVRSSNVLNYIKDIGDSRKKFIDFAHYMEALVAYHRYFGGKD